MVNMANMVSMVTASPNTRLEAAEVVAAAAAVVAAAVAVAAVVLWARKAKKVDMVIMENTVVEVMM